MFTQISHSKQRQQGFTLLELLVVISLLGLLALSATALVENVGEQDRFEATRSRLAQIRTAIIGDTSRTLNGEPMLSGYVADMGRLPINLQELVEIGVSQPAWGPIALNTVSGVSVGVTGEIYGGWRGPYLPSTPEIDSVSVSGSRTFRDGWGTATSAVQPNDYGWVVTKTPAIEPFVTIKVQSLGADGIAGGTDYDADYPNTGSPTADNLVNSSDWQLDLSAASFNVEFNQATIQTDLELRVYFFENAGVEEEISNSFSLGVSGVSGVMPNPPVSIAGPLTLPMGRYAAVVMCTQGTPTLNDDVVYDGDCIAPATHQPYYFTLLPSSYLPIKITWNTP
ncbi:MAG: prepilin-type N-terminal cleavage/methylation domain-containing protein [Methylococcales bacterium]